MSRDAVQVGQESEEVLDPHHPASLGPGCIDQPRGVAHLPVEADGVAVGVEGGERTDTEVGGDLVVGSLPPGAAPPRLGPRSQLRDELRHVVRDGEVEAVGVHDVDAELLGPSAEVVAVNAQHHQGLEIVDDPVDVEEQDRFHGHGGEISRVGPAPRSRSIRVAMRQRRSCPARSVAPPTPGCVPRRRPGSRRAARHETPPTPHQADRDAAGLPVPDPWEHRTGRCDGIGGAERRQPEAADKKPSNAPAASASPSTVGVTASPATSAVKVA